MEEPNQLFQNAVKIVDVIIARHGRNHIPKEDIHGEVECPICKKGIMKYSISAYNGHRDALCSTGCFGYYVE